MLGKNKWWAGDALSTERYSGPSSRQVGAITWAKLVYIVTWYMFSFCAENQGGGKVIVNWEPSRHFFTEKVPQELTPSEHKCRNKKANGEDGPRAYQIRSR